MDALYFCLSIYLDLLTFLSIIFTLFYPEVLHLAHVFVQLNPRGLMFYVATAIFLCVFALRHATTGSAMLELCMALFE